MEIETDNRRFDFFIFFINNFHFYTYCLASTCSQLIKNFLEIVQLPDLIDSLNDLVVHHSFVKFAVFGIVSSFAIPVLLFAVFAIASIIFTFAGFVLIEGIILGAGLLCMVIFLITMIMGISFMTILLGMFYTLIKKIKIN